MKQLIIDRIEENIAVCVDESEAIVGIELAGLPFTVKEGNVISLFEDGRVELDTATETQRREALFDLQESLFDE